MASTLEESTGSPAPRATPAREKTAATTKMTRAATAMFTANARYSYPRERAAARERGPFWRCVRVEQFSEVTLEPASSSHARHLSGPVARAFLVVRLERAGDDLRSVVPRACVSATYGADGGDGTTHDRELVATVHAKNFAFPERDLSQAICDAAEGGGGDAAPPLTYTFSLTEGDGSRTTGFCRRIARARVRRGRAFERRHRGVHPL